MDHYQVSPKTGSKTLPSAICEVSPCTVYNLTAGLAYTFTVRAIGPSGAAGPWSTSSAAITARSPAPPDCGAIVKSETIPLDETDEITVHGTTCGAALTLARMLIAKYPNYSGPLPVTGWNCGAAYGFEVSPTGTLFTEYYACTTSAKSVNFTHYTGG